ncbi:CAMK family protein kinase [Histomonas meleagridis]|uniref:CAMK family protein kinase n=1 Tax=Histomonas meleagridis TaxID=135588 RepID=UPI0035593A83|nr:CAMK family protein kinase [Histomonas meleagridis]KAH0805551.1 CAMK family protein kinase [Histomonas meleagridis]
MKTIYKSKLTNPKQVSALVREIQILKFFDENRHITELYDVLDVIDGIYLILEYAEGGDLFSYISSKKTLHEFEVKRFFHSIVKSVSIMHNNGYVHRDLKLENILLDINGRVMLADFGCSREFKEGEYTSSLCGTVQYEAPEVLLCNSYDATKVDSWSLGIILYVLFFRCFPFDATSVCEALDQFSREICIPDNCNISKSARNVLIGLLCNDPNRRMKVVDVLQHDWLKKISSSHCDELKKNRIKQAALRSLQERNTKNMDANKLVAYRIMKRMYQLGKMAITVMAPQRRESELGRINTPKARAREHRSMLIFRPMSTNIAQRKILDSLVPPAKIVL